MLGSAICICSRAKEEPAQKQSTFLPIVPAIDFRIIASVGCHEFLIFTAQIDELSFYRSRVLLLVADPSASCVCARMCVCVCVREIRRTCWKVTRFFLSFCVKTAKNTFQYLTVALVNLVFLLSFLR